MLPSSDQPTNDRSKQLKRYGPLYPSESYAAAPSLDALVPL